MSRLASISWSCSPSWSVVVVAALAACGPAARGQADAAKGADGSANTGDGSNGDNCSDSAKLVYVIDITGHLLRFDPMVKMFADLGALSCPAQFGATPFSMGVDRNAIAWVLYNSGELFHVDTTTLACSKTSWASPDNLVVFGMGFSTDQAGGTTDSLFICGSAQQTVPPFTLAHVDPASLAVTTLGTETTPPEMTGTGAAELWGFIPDPTVPRVVKLDKTNGTALKTFQETTLAASGPAYAFAFWGGDFWIFFMFPTETESKVYQVDGMTGQIKSTTPAGREIVGAGVSTCAPIVVQ